MKIHKILVPLDFGPVSEAVLDYARALAQASDATLHLLHVVDDLAARFVDFPFAQVGDAQQTMEAAAWERLEELARRETALGHVATAKVLTATSAANAIVDTARDENMDLIVMGTHGRGAIARMLLGAVAERVVRTSPCPVLTVREALPPREFVTPGAETASLSF